jgi:hypothetical protein
MEELMDYETSIQNIDDKQLAAAVLGAMERLFRLDMSLLEKDVHERAIASQLARHMQPYFPDHNVDVEYNLMGDVPKRLSWNGGPALVYPDLVVHQRGTDSENVMVVEIKKSSNAASKDDDVQKLVAFRQELGYGHALFIRFGVGNAAGTVLECEWVNA